jgi:GNAT superfamily N-acetyltransferase
MSAKEDIRVRSFRKADLVRLKSLIGRTIDVCYVDWYCAEAVQFFKDYHTEQAILRDAAESFTIVLDRGGQILGTGTLVGDEIKRVFVDPAFQKQGWGRLLMQHLEHRAASSGIEVVKLDASLPAKAFYDKMDYVTTEKTFLAVGNGRRLDFFRMRRAL